MLTALDLILHASLLDSPSRPCPVREPMRTVWAYESTPIRTCPLPPLVNFPCLSPLYPPYPPPLPHQTCEPLRQEGPVSLSLHLHGQTRPGKLDVSESEMARSSRSFCPGREAPRQHVLQHVPNRWGGQGVETYWPTRARQESVMIQVPVRTDNQVECLVSMSRI